MAVFRRILAIFGLILAMFLTFQSYNFDAFAHAGAPLGVEWLCKNFTKIVFTVFEKFEIFMKRSGEKKPKKRHVCISSRKFFPTPKQSYSQFRGVAFRVQAKGKSITDMESFEN